MRYFYIDTEHTEDYSFIKNWDISKEDTIFMFVSVKSQSIKFKDLHFFTDGKINFIYKHIEQKDKAFMNFRIFVELIQINSTIKNSTHYIVSDSNEFKSYMDYINKISDSTKIYLIKPCIDTGMLELLDSHTDSETFNKAVEIKFKEQCGNQVSPTYVTILNDAIRKKELKYDVNKIMINSKNCTFYRNNLRKKFGNKVGNSLYWETKDVYIKLKEERSEEDDI